MSFVNSIRSPDNHPAVASNAATCPMPLPTRSILWLIFIAVVEAARVIPPNTCTDIILRNTGVMEIELYDVRHQGLFRQDVSQDPVPASDAYTELGGHYPLFAETQRDAQGHLPRNAAGNLARTVNEYMHFPRLTLIATLN
jgi:hypothetical protein